MASGVSRRPDDYGQALSRYGKARKAAQGKKGEERRDQAVAKVDSALDALLVAPSPTIAAFGHKLRILQLEYGLWAQPRHMAALYADAALLAWLSAAAVLDKLT